MNKSAMSSETEPPTTTDYAFDMAENVYMRICAGFTYAAEWLDLERKWILAKQFASEHPIIALFTVIVTVMCTVPILCFIVFVVCSFSVMFTAFVFFEGKKALFVNWQSCGFLCVSFCVVDKLPYGSSAVLNAVQEVSTVLRLYSILLIRILFIFFPSFFHTWETFRLLPIIFSNVQSVLSNYYNNYFQWSIDISVISFW